MSPEQAFWSQGRKVGMVDLSVSRSGVALSSRLPASTRAAWLRRAAVYWATHVHRCHACGRPIRPDAAPGSGQRGEVHHVRYRYDDGVKTGDEPDEWLILLCSQCHDEERCARQFRHAWTLVTGRWRCPCEGPSLHAVHRRKSRRKGWMVGQDIVDPDRHYRSLERSSVWWIRRRRVWGWLTFGGELPAWKAPGRRQR